MVRAEPPSQRVFGEIQRIEQLAFTYGEERQAAENVEDLCENMAFYPPEHYLKGDNLLFDFEPAVISDCLAGLDRNSFNAFLRSKEIPSESLDQTEPWFGTPFSSSPVPDGWRRPCPKMAKVGRTARWPGETCVACRSSTCRRKTGS
jgi:nardilysin